MKLLALLPLLLGGLLVGCAAQGHDAGSPDVAAAAKPEVRYYMIADT